MVTCSHAADLGLQAAQRVVSSGPEQALRVLRDLAQNLPVQARWVWSYCNGLWPDWDSVWSDYGWVYKHAS